MTQPGMINIYWTKIKRTAANLSSDFPLGSRKFISELYAGGLKDASYIG